jgi:ATP-dependent Lhr-like helicase
LEISATIGNLEQAKDVLLAPTGLAGVIVGQISEAYQHQVFPDEIEKYPWLNGAVG